MEDWCDLLGELLALRETFLFVPDLAGLDSETLGLLRAFLRERPDAFPPITVGFDPETPEADERGIVWGSSPVTLSSFLFSLRHHPRAERIDARNQETGFGDLSQDEDGRLLVEFSATSGPCGPELSQAMADLVHRAFAGYAFEAALLWGLRLLERQPELAPEEAARVHGLVALAAHNRQFHSRGNRVLASTLEEHLRSALEVEVGPGWKSATAYRLAVTLGRRQGRLDEAMELAQIAVQAAASGGLLEPAAAYLEAWGFNIRAFLWMRRGLHGRAKEDTETALEILERTRGSMDAVAAETRASWERDVLLSWGVVAHNRTALAHLTDDSEGLAHWRRRADELVDRFPELELFEVDSWLDFYREIVRLDLALEKARRGVELARQEREPQWEYRYLAQVADLAYRLGSPEESVEACEEARRFRASHGVSSLLVPLHPLHASALGRAGRLGEARDVASLLLQSPQASPTAEVQGHALVARLAAAQDDAGAAERHANAAIEVAVGHGHRDSLLCAAAAAGAASDRLGRPEEAREAFEKALEIAQAGEPGDPAPPAGDVLEALLGVGVRQPGQESRLVRALRWLPAALKEPDTWWRLEPLAVAVHEVGLRDRSVLQAPELAEPLDKLLAACRQRRDAEDLAGRLGELRETFSRAVADEEPAGHTQGSRSEV